MSQQGCMITTPIFYVNGSPHIGHAYTSLAADVLARFSRLDGTPTYFVSGTDEHGQKVAQTAAREGVSPKTFADRISSDFRRMQKGMEVFPDNFIRTTSPEHARAAQALWQRLADRGHIYPGAYEGWYSTRDEAFVAEEETEVSEGGIRVAAATGAPVEWVREPSYFFRLSAFTDRLLELYRDQPDFMAPYGTKREVESFVQAGLRDLSISRTSFDWGVPVPGDPKHVMYVWFDALANYLTAVGFPDGKSEYAAFWPAQVQIIGKEIARFHCVYWPAFLMAADLPLPRHVFAHGWWTVEGQKMSKSLGNVLDPGDLTAEFGVDQLRYFLMREVPFGGDSNFSRRALIARINGELANELGNLAQRTLTLINRNMQGHLPEKPGLAEEDRELLAGAGRLLPLMRGRMAHFALGEGLSEVWKIVRAANIYIDMQAPWKLGKENPERMEAVLWVLAEVLRKIAIMLQPYLPASMANLLDQLAVPSDARSFSDLKKESPPRSLPAPTPLFPRIADREESRVLSD